MQSTRSLLSLSLLPSIHIRAYAAHVCTHFLFLQRPRFPAVSVIQTKRGHTCPFREQELNLLISLASCLFGCDSRAFTTIVWTRNRCEKHTMASFFFLLLLLTFANSPSTTRCFNWMQRSSNWPISLSLSFLAFCSVLILVRILPPTWIASFTTAFRLSFSPCQLALSCFSCGFCKKPTS